MLDIIKEYLVSLGFKVDAKSFKQVQNNMNEVEKTVSKFAGTSVTSFAIAGAAVVSFVAAANVGIAKFITGLAKADLENEKLARRLWTTKETATAYNNALKSMGATLDDLYLSPELRENFFKLMNQTKSLRPPDEYASQMKFIRSIMFEFQRLKLIVTYSMQWIGYYLNKYLEGPLKKIKGGMTSLNDVLIKNLPHWTKNVAEVLSVFVRLGITIWRAAGDVWTAITKVTKGIPKEFKLMFAAIAAIGGIFAMGPIGIIIAALVGLLLILDDFYTYLDGGDSEFKGFYDWVKKIADEFNNSDFKKSLDDLISSIREFVGASTDLLETIGFFKVLRIEAEGTKNILVALAGFIRNSIIDDFKYFAIAVQSITVEIKILSDFLTKVKETLINIANSIKNINPSKILGSLPDLAKGILGNTFHILPQSNTQTPTVNNKMESTVNVYGSEASATGKAAARTVSDLWIRSTRGMVL